MSVWLKSSNMFFKSMERSTTTRSRVGLSVSSYQQREGDGPARASVPTSMVALSLEISQIFCDAGFASAIVIIVCLEKRLWM